jgi:Ca2+-binding EF-hand superfamily protein
MMDNNKDGQVDRKEMVTSLIGVGGITETEALELVNAVFAEADVDKNGKMNITEFQNMN